MGCTSYRLAVNATGSDSKIRGVIFDMDGTLTRPQAWMFKEMRSALHTPQGSDLLDFVSTLPEEKIPVGSGRKAYDHHGPQPDFSMPPDTKQEAERRLQYIEAKAMILQEPTNGVKRALTNLQKEGIQIAICTRNVPTPVEYFLEHVVHKDGLSSDAFNWDGPIVTREFQPPKPSPKPLLHIIDQFNKRKSPVETFINPQDVLMVGDSSDDMSAGLNAGCGTVLINHGEHGNDIVAKTMKIDAIVKDLDEFVNLVNTGITITRESLS
ncbi:putative haloacid dehalogenase-like hydrolase [Martiniozyma asiatica (nom. inval.)]|nr:putative haloacid dehalogenase-like hydrolase [Martiniozyma asiatica]